MAKNRQNKWAWAKEVNEVHKLTVLFKVGIMTFRAHNGKYWAFFGFDDDFLMNFMNICELRESQALFCPVENKQPRGLCELCVNF